MATAESHTDLNAKALEGQFIVNFDRRCTILMSEQERAALYSALGDYRTTGQLNPLLDRLSRILNSPIKMELIEDLRHFVQQRHLAQFDRDMPFGDMGAKVVKILNSTPSYDQRQRSRATTPRSLTPRPTADIGRTISRGEKGGERKKFEISRTDGKQQLGFVLSGIPNAKGGIFIKTVLPFSMADRAGLRGGDRLLIINDEPVNDLDLGQVAELIENSKTLRIHVLRNPSKSPKRDQENGANRALPTEEWTVQPPGHYAGNASRRTEVTPPSSFRPSTFGNAGSVKSSIFGGRSHEVINPGFKSATSTVSLPSLFGSRFRGTKPTGSKGQPSDDEAPLALERFQSPSNTKLRTKTVITLNGRKINDDSDSIRIEEIPPGANDVTTEPTAAWSISTTFPRSPRNVIGLSGEIQLPIQSQMHPPHNQMQHPPSAPHPPRRIEVNFPKSRPESDYRLNTIAISPADAGGSSKVIPLIRTCISQNSPERIRAKSPAPGGASISTLHVAGRKIIQPEINLVPDAARSEKIPPSPSLPTTTTNASLPTVRSTFSPKIASPRRQNDHNPLPNPDDYYHHYYHQHHQQQQQGRPSLRRYNRPNSTLPHMYTTPIRSGYPIFPAVVPQYHAVPRRDENDRYLEQNFPHPGRWKSAEEAWNPWNAYNNNDDDDNFNIDRFHPWRQRQNVHKSNPDLSRRHAHYESTRDTTPIERQDYNGNYNKYYYNYNHNAEGGWRSDRDIDYGSNRHRRRIRRLPNFRRGEKSEFSDFETLLIPSHRPTGNRKYEAWNERERDGYGRVAAVAADAQFRSPPQRSRSNNPPVYHQSHVSNEASFRRNLPSNSRVLLRVPNFDETTSFADENETPPFPEFSRRSRHDQSERESRRYRQSRRTLKSSFGWVSTSPDRRSHFTSRTTAPTIKPKFVTKSPLPLPRSRKTPSISSISSNFTITAVESSTNLIDSTNNIPTGGSNRNNNRNSSSNNNNNNNSSAATTTNDSAKFEQSDEKSGISLLVYSKLNSPGASFKSDGSAAKTRPDENFDFDAATSVRSQSPPTDDQRHHFTSLPSPPSLYRSDSRSSLEIGPTSKSGQYDFVEATSEFNGKRPVESGESESHDGRAAMPGRDFIEASFEVMDAAKKESSSGGRLIDASAVSWNKSLNLEFDKGKSKPVEILSREKNKSEKGNYFSDKFVKDPEEANTNMDSADSGVSLDIHLLGSPLKLSKGSTNPQPGQPAKNHGYSVYRIENKSRTTSPIRSSDANEAEFRPNQSLSYLSPSSLPPQITISDIYRSALDPRWRPTASRRTIKGRQKIIRTIGLPETPDGRIRVELDKTCSYLGLSISGGRESKICPDVVIDSITEGSAADVEGSLKAGMKLLSVDGQSLLDVLHSEAVQIIKSSFLDKTRRWMILEACS